MELTENNKGKSFEEINNTWVHTFIALDKNHLIGSHSRLFKDSSVYELDEALGIVSNKVLDRSFKICSAFNYDKIYNALRYFIDKQEKKEIEFIKNCLKYMDDNKVEEILIFTTNN